MLLNILRFSTPMSFVLLSFQSLIFPRHLFVLNTRNMKIDIKNKKETNTHTHTKTHTHKDTQTHRHTHTNTQTHTHIDI